jgi:hypothetical protein
VSSKEFYFDFLPDKFKLFGARPGDKLTDVLSLIARKAGKDPHIRDNYRILIAKQVTFPQKLSFEQLGIEDGDYVFLVPISQPPTILRFLDENEEVIYTATEREITIGRMDTKESTKHEFNLTPYLKRPEYISREQGILSEINGKWYLSLHPNSTSNIFINQKQLKKGQMSELVDSTIVSFGYSPTNVELHLVISLRAD